MLHVVHYMTRLCTTIITVVYARLLGLFERSICFFPSSFRLTFDVLAVLNIKQHDDVGMIFILSSYIYPPWNHETQRNHGKAYLATA